MEVSSWENHRTKLWIFQHVRSEDTGGYSPMFHSYSVGISLCHLTSHQYPMFFFTIIYRCFSHETPLFTGDFPSVSNCLLVKSPEITNHFHKISHEITNNPYQIPWNQWFSAHLCFNETTNPSFPAVRQVWGHRGGPRWAALECYSEEDSGVRSRGIPLYTDGNLMIHQT